ncbi:MAG TPA: tetratricopeptide repeat protein [Candidatus Limnocylindrales bacterium]|nr:tetratricopeptide repeat protein [Candidatus Limnocylindrales bacterium]
MVALGRWSLILLALLALVSPVAAAPSPEERAFKDAQKSFQDMIWDRAEAEFAAFAQNYTNSAQFAEAVLFQAEARFWQTNYAGAIGLLMANQKLAGALADEYEFWIAEARLHKGEYQPAADAFAALVQNFPNSTRRLRATVEEASARSELQQWPQIIALLEQTNGVFQTSASTNAASDLLANGFLLLARAQLAEKNPSAAERVLERLAKIPIDSATQWHRAYLVCQVKLAEGLPEEALGNVTNLFAAAARTGQLRFKAETFSVQASILQRLGRTSDAIAAYTNNLAQGMPSDRRQEAWLKIGALSLAQQNVVEAAQTLQQYLAQFTNAPAEDVAWLTLGELRLRQALTGSGTNLLAGTETNAVSSTEALDQSIQALKTIPRKFPQSPLFGKAQLNLGWCFWAARKIPESQAAFQAAIGRLPVSIDQAVAFFKLADTEFRQTNFAAAITHYQAVVEKFPHIPEVQTNLAEPALYQIVRAELALGDLTGVTNALGSLLGLYPGGFHTDRAVLLSGQAVGKASPAAARTLFSSFVKSSPNASLRPEVELAIARTYEQEDQWPDAIHQYDFWLDAFTNHPAQPRAEYSRAWANFQANREPEAFNQFTNFLSRFPADEFAPRAQWWIADFFYRKGDLTAAEQNYKWCYQNTNWAASSELAYQARLMAGRCAIKRQAWEDAKDYFIKLINDTSNCPPDLQAQAWFALGDTLMSQINPDSTNRVPDYGAAITAFDKIPLLFPTNPITPLALGEKACCLLQLAQNPQDYSRVTNGFISVIDSPLADARARSIAKVGLGIALEKLADKSSDPASTTLLIGARDHYLDVFYGKILRDGEKPDPFWTREAGLKAGHVISDSLKQRAQAIAIYQQLQNMCPALRLDEKITALKTQEQEARREN